MRLRLHGAGRVAVHPKHNTEASTGPCPASTLAGGCMLPAHPRGHLPPDLGGVVAIVLLQVSKLVLHPPHHASVRVLDCQGIAVQEPLPARAGLALSSTAAICMLCCWWMCSKLGDARCMIGKRTLKHLGLGTA